MAPLIDTKCAIRNSNLLANSSLLASALSLLSLDRWSPERNFSISISTYWRIIMKISALLDPLTIVDDISTRAISYSPHVASPTLGVLSRRSSSPSSSECPQTPASSNNTIFADMGLEKYTLFDSDSEIFPSREYCLEASTDYSSQPLADDTLSMTSDDGIPCSPLGEPGGPSERCSQSQEISQDSDDYDIFTMLAPTDSGSDEALIDVFLNNTHAPSLAEEPEEVETSQQEDGDGEGDEEGEGLDARFV